MNMPKPFNNKRNAIKIRKASTTESYKQMKRSCVDMEELMQFEAARQRALAQAAPDDYKRPFSEFLSKRAFINHIDGFIGSHIVKLLASQPSNFALEGGESQEPKSKEYDTSNQGSNTNYQGDDDTFEDSEEDVTESNPGQEFEILGTLNFINTPDYKKPDEVSELLDEEKKGEFLEKLLTCGFIIYDVTNDMSCHPKQCEEAKWVAESIVKRLEEFQHHEPKAFKTYKDCRTLILISTLLAWGRTKPIDPKDQSLPFTEKDYRKRKPHPNYKAHCQTEKRIIELGKLFPDKFKTLVIGSGIPYGHEEDVFHFYFRMAWQDDPHLPLFGKGNNILPVIHIDSLASVVQNVIENFPENNRYIIATDPHSVTLKEVVRLLAKMLGNGKIKQVSEEDALQYAGVTQRNYDMLTCNVNVQPGYILNNPLLKWGTDRKFTDNIKKLILEFKTARNLMPIKILVHGPPVSGKTFLAKRLALFYDLPFLDKELVIKEHIQRLKDKIHALENKHHDDFSSRQKEKVSVAGDEASEVGDDEDFELEEQEDLDTLKENLRHLEDAFQEKDGQLDNETILKIFKERLMMNSSQNKGYVINGYPETLEDTKILYKPDEGDEEMMGEDDDDTADPNDVTKYYNTHIMPQYIECLDASDEFLIDRMIKLPEGMTHIEETLMCSRLAEYRNLNTEDNTPLIFYDELDVHPMIYNVENDLDPNMEPTFRAMLNHIGRPKNYSSERSLRDVIADLSDPYKTSHLNELKKQRDEVKKAAQERRENLEKWMFSKNQELEMEEKALTVMGMPLRHYLMKYVFPCLTRGLVEVARLRPDDPVDFLAEFLFRENPEGKMFQPDYEERERQLTEALKEYEASAYLKHPMEVRSSRKTFSTEKSVKSEAAPRIPELKCSLVSAVSRKSSSKRTVSVTSEVCTCKKSPSLSTCSSDKTPSAEPSGTLVSCSCSSHESDECEPCETPPDEIEACKCPCVT